MAAAERAAVEVGDARHRRGVGRRLHVAAEQVPVAHVDGETGDAEDRGGGEGRDDRRHASLVAAQPAQRAAPARRPPTGRGLVVEEVNQTLVPPHRAVSLPTGRALSKP